MTGKITRIVYRVAFEGDKATVRDAINWLFDNCSEDFEIERVRVDEEFDAIPAISLCDRDTTDMAILFYGDRDMVLFKTFWNDR
ncbi:hypothetical protein ACLBV5_09600 [Brevundimonas sp. M1A4_2e]